MPTSANRLRFSTPEPPTILFRVSGGTNTDNNLVEHQNMFAPLMHQQGANSGDEGNEALSSGIFRGGSASAASSSRGSRGRDPTPLTPEILLLLDRLEPDKGKQARLLTERLTGQRTLPSKEHELHKLLERKAEKEIKRQHATSEAAASRATKGQMEAHEAAMAVHLAQQAMEAALVAGATQDEAIAAGHVVMEAARGADGTEHMLD